ncbi:MAG TPA: FAD-binding protein [Candidatus Ventrimonas merdavium]|nr:FAD-binding protein [Candidatus Ventrimonas merdavium]
MKKKGLASVVLAASMMLAACSGGTTQETTQAPETTAAPETEAETTEEAEAAGGTYEITAAGYGGEMQVTVTIADGAVTDIALGENHESKVVIDRAFPLIRERILEAGTPVVDSVSGATFSSYAVKWAVGQAMAEAGLEVEEITMATAGPEKEAVTLDDVETDIVVVGGGPAGLAAAITAKETNDAANIIVVEKMDILSGNGKFDMNFYDLINSEAQKAAGNEKWTVNQVENFIEAKSSAGDTPERVAVWAEQENQLDAWLRGMGVELDYNYSNMNHMAKEDQYAGEVIQEGMEKRAYELGLDIRTGTKGTDLVMEDGRCVGVTVTNNNNESYTIKAKNTIIATGGFCSSKELLAEYAPGYEVLNTSNQIGTTGDFVKVFEANGFKMEHMDNVRVFPSIIVPNRDLTGGADLDILVNKEGQRFIDETIETLERGTAIQAQTSGAAFMLTDGTGYDSFYRIRKHVDAGYFKQADTWEGLAEELGIDPAGLTETIEKFNAAAEAGENDELQGAPAARPFDAEGPYYGARIEAANHMTKGGVSCNEKAQVLYEDGTPVEGLYAAGEVTWQSGGYSQSVSFGREAGKQAATTLE